jgi:hypothetical protein
MSPASALVHLSANSSAAHLLDSAGRAAEFLALSALVRAVPCVALAGPDAGQPYAPFVSRVLEWARACAIPAAR